MGEFIRVGKKSELSESAGTLVNIGEKKIALFKIRGQVYALDDACSHSGGPLSQGEVHNEEVVCPWHNGRFNICTGAAMDMPAETPVSTYKVHCLGDDILVEVE